MLSSVLYTLEQDTFSWLARVVDISISDEPISMANCPELHSTLKFCLLAFSRSGTELAGYHFRQVQWDK